MAAIRSKGNKSTEIAFLTLLKKYKIIGWRRHYKNIKGSPDFVFPKYKLAIFLDGCFWHGCPRCMVKPKSNTKFWESKIWQNKKRDLEVNKALRNAGWKVVRIWEHEIKKGPAREMNKIKKILKTN